MRPVVIVLLSICCGAVPAAVAAQDDPPEPAVEVKTLGVSLERIRTKLERRPDGARLLLNVDSYITVYGARPRLPLAVRQARYQSLPPIAPTLHTEMMRVVRPNPVYPAAVPIGANPVASWAWRALR